MSVSQSGYYADLETPLVPVVLVSFGHRGQTFNFFSAVTVLGTPQDITLQELRVECFFPMDDATGAAARALFDAAERVSMTMTEEP